MTTQRPLSETFLPLSSQGSSSGPSSGSKYRLSADMSTLNLQPPPLSPVATHHHHRGPRPNSEILVPANYSSPEADAIDKWVEDLQHYERTLEEMATASLDQNFKDELSHVDQWFRFLSEAERTAALYSLLQHSTQVQIRFFINTLQQMARRDPMGALLSPANPEKDSMQAQLAGAMAKAELEASQKLYSVLGQPAAATRSNPTRRLYDRHSVTLADAEEYGRILGGGSTRPPNDFLSPRSATFAPSTSFFDDATARARLKAVTNGRPNQGLYSSARPKSAIEGDGSSIFSGDWSYGSRNGGGVIGDRANINSSIGDRTSSGRPKSADMSNWSLGGMPSVLDQRERGSTTTPWGLSPTVGNFNERGPIERPKSATQAELENALANFTLGNSGQRIVLDDAKNFRRSRLTPGSKMSNVPLTVPESDEKSGGGANIVLSMYDDRGTRQELLTPNGRGNSMRSPAPSPRTPSFPPPTTPRSPSRPTSRSTSPAPPTPTSGLFPGHPSWGERAKFGQFLDPYGTSESGDVEYMSDHSDNSNISGAGRKPASARAAKDKKAAESVDLELLSDIPGWLRSLRLHKYNNVFESMRWQDIVRMSDDDLQAKGVAALGARRKFLKVFENVKAHCDSTNIPY